MSRFKDIQHSMDNDKMRKKNITPLILSFKREYPDATLSEINFFVMGYKLAQRG